MPSFGGYFFLWKVNVLGSMGNHDQEKYLPFIIAACESQNQKIREMAELIRSEQLTTQTTPVKSKLGT
jgi:hypothetical protein